MSEFNPEQGDMIEVAKQDGEFNDIFGVFVCMWRGWFLVEESDGEYRTFQYARAMSCEPNSHQITGEIE